ELKSAPRIKSRIAGKGTIEGDFTSTEVREMVTTLRAGSLPVDIDLLQETSVGPKLGQDAIQRGLRAIAFGGLLVLLFVGIYYIRCGLVADGALILNLVLLTGVLGFLGAALTLPGVAGILLTVGMAVDANVLIYERIREEVRAGKTVHVALRNGYERAYSTIIDANVTTLLTAVILYMVGTGPVRGFAVTLSAGLILSMFTALYVTRLALETSVSRGWISEFSMFSFIGETTISFSKGRRVAYAVSAIVLAVGAVAFFGQGTSLYGVDFTGGSLVYLSFEEPVSTGEVRSRITEAGYDDAQIQGIQGDKESKEATSRDFRVRIKGVGRSRLENDLKPELLDKLKSAEVQLKEDALVVGEDGSTMTLSLAEPVSEMKLREILGGDDAGRFEIDDVRKIVSLDDGESDKFTIRMAALPALPDMEEIWLDLWRVASFAKVERSMCQVELSEIETMDKEADEYQIVAQTGREIQWQDLALELRRRQLSGVSVVEKDESGTTFEIRGPREELEGLQKEMPEELNLPEVTFDGPGITASIQDELTEKDIRAYADQEDLMDVYVVPRETKSSRFSLHVSQEPIKSRLNDIFADMGGQSVTVSDFEVVEERDDGTAQVKMDLSPSLTMSAISYYIEAAGFGDKADDMIVSETEDPTMRLSTLVLDVPASSVEKVEELVTDAFQEAHSVRQIVSFGAVVAREMKGRALLAVICAAVVVVFYIAFRFHAIRYGIAAVIAVVHDVAITAGIIALADWSGMVGDIKINLSMLAAFLTILGYSLNDTIVVFDRIRENTIETGKKAITGELVDKSVNETLSRTILTSVTTLMAVLALYIFGGSQLRGLAFTLIIGILVGTYSSVYIASPILLDWDKLSRGAGVTMRVVTFPLRLPFLLIAKLT
ncbi:MAG: protein translocase subunit SecF, partial [Planctomycetota bacterium]